jgi:hypothetical protein
LLENDTIDCDENVGFGSPTLPIVHVTAYIGLAYHTFALLNKGANPLLKSSLGYNAFELAESNHKSSVYDMMLEWCKQRGYKLDNTIFKYNALAHTDPSSHVVFVPELNRIINLGDDLDALIKNKQIGPNICILGGSPIIHETARIGLVEPTEKLLDYGADPMIRFNNLNAFDVAEKNHNSLVYNRLSEWYFSTKKYINGAFGTWIKDYQ